MSSADVGPALIQTLDRISMVLGALFSAHLGDIGQDLKAERLSRCGFTNVQIASILGTTANAVNVSLHRVRRGGRTRGRPRKAAKAKKR